MNTLPLRIPLLLCLCAALAACAVSSPPIQYLQLSAGNVAVPERGTLSVALDAVAVPDYLLRNELLLRDSAYSLRYRADRRWAEPLDLGIQRVLARRLAAELDTRQVSAFPEVARMRPDWELRVSVQRFEILEGRATLKASGVWTPRDGAGHTRQQVDFEATQPLPEPAIPSAPNADVAIALSELLWRFAEALAEPLR
jgi:uncharacterized lipoprotein YmbA